MLPMTYLFQYPEVIIKKSKVQAVKKTNLRYYYTLTKQVSVDFLLLLNL